jgi:hypothetical protein
VVQKRPRREHEGEMLSCALKDKDDAAQGGVLFQQCAFGQVTRSGGQRQDARRFAAAAERREPRNQPSRTQLKPCDASIVAQVLGAGEIVTYVTAESRKDASSGA